MTSIESLPKTTFGGRRLTRTQLARVQETVQTFSRLSRNELALTVCEHLDWTPPRGTLKVQSCLSLLDTLEDHGVITLPPKRVTKAPVRRVPTFPEPPDSRPVEGPLASGDAECTPAGDDASGPSALEGLPADLPLPGLQASVRRPSGLPHRVRAPAAGAGRLRLRGVRRLGLGPQRSVDRLGHDASIDTVVVGPEQRPLRHLPLGHGSQSREPRPLAGDHPHRGRLGIPARISPGPHRNICGSHTLLRDLLSGGELDTPGPDPRAWAGCPPSRVSRDQERHLRLSAATGLAAVLDQGHRQADRKKRYRNDLASSHTRSVGEAFITLWEHVVTILHEVAAEYDAQWRVRTRVIDSMILLLLIFRLVSSKHAQGYGTTIDDLWDSCDRLQISLPQKSSIAPSSFCGSSQRSVQLRPVYMANKSSINSDLRGFRTPSVSGEELQTPGVRPTGDGGIARGLPVPRG